MADQKQRGYTGLSDSLMLQEAGSIHSIFEDDQAEFETFDSDFGGTFASDMAAAILAAGSFPTDEQIRDEISDLGQLTEDEMEKSRNNFQDAKIFVKKAFPGRPTMWDRFGFDDYDDARDSKHKMQTFMERYQNMVEEFTAELLDVNFTADMQAEVATRTTALRDAIKAEKKREKERPEITQQRVDGLNAVWTFLQKIAETAKSIYRDDFAKYNQYLLPGRANNPEEPFNVLITAKDANTGNLLEGAQGNFTDLGVTAISGDDGVIPFSGIPSGTHNVEITLDNYQLLAISLVVVDEEVTEIEVMLIPV